MTDSIAAAAARIRAIPAAVEAALDAAVQSAAAACAETARGLAPVDSGALRSSISAVSAGNCSAVVTASAGHAAMVEYGTSRMPPQPYMVPAAEAARETLVASASAAVRGGIGGAKG